jgi:hypothetical protein
LNKALVRIEQKIGTIKNTISVSDKKKKKQKSNTTSEDYNKMLEDLIYHKEQWKKLCNMTIKYGFYE